MHQEQRRAVAADHRVQAQLTGVTAEPGSGPALRLIELEPLDSLPVLTAGEVDVAVTHSYSNVAQEDHPGVETTQIAQEQVLPAVPRPTTPPGPGGQRQSGVSDTEPKRLADYACAQWIVPHRRWSCYAMVERACGRAGFVPNAVAEATDFAAQLALVAAGAGVALIPELGCVAVPEDVTLRRLADPVHRHLHLAGRRGWHADPGLGRLADMLGRAARTAVSSAS